MGCLTSKFGNSICYSESLDQWIFKDSDGDDYQYYYYPQWAWGSRNNDWYLFDALHDVWVTAAQ